MDDTGTNCLHHAVINGNLPLIKKFIESEKMDVNAVDRYEDTPLMKSVMYQYDDGFKYLLSKGSDVHKVIIVH